MAFPDPAFIVHETGEPDDLGHQRCTRCGQLLYSAAPIAVGRQVAVSGTGGVRMVVHPGKHAYAECDAELASPPVS
jgi:hypothetical protein